MNSLSCLLISYCLIYFEKCDVSAKCCCCGVLGTESTERDSLLCVFFSYLLSLFLFDCVFDEDCISFLKSLAILLAGNNDC